MASRRDGRSRGAGKHRGVVAKKPALSKGLISDAEALELLKAESEQLRRYARHYDRTLVELEVLVEKELDGKLKTKTDRERLERLFMVQGKLRPMISALKTSTGLLDKAKRRTASAANADDQAKKDKLDSIRKQFNA